MKTAWERELRMFRLVTPTRRLERPSLTRERAEDAEDTGWMDRFSTVMMRSFEEPSRISGVKALCCVTLGYRASRSLRDSRDRASSRCKSP